MHTRRDLFRIAAVGATLAALPRITVAADPAPGFTLPKLPYAYDALAPIIDAETMTIHHTKHHQAYVDNLNKALGTQPDLLKKPIEEILTHLKDVNEGIRGAVRNNGGGHWNHTFFWNCMAKPGTGGEASPELSKAIEASFGGMDGFKKAFTAAAVGQFGSGWAWLVPGKDKPLAIVATPNQDNPMMTGGPAPLLGVDVWEHAYYISYRNLRAKYVEAWYGVVNWTAVSANFAAIKKA